MKKKKRTQDEIRRDNEKRRSRISDEFGAIFGTSEGMSPELENQFLKNIELFEKQYVEAKRVSVYERIGEPEWIAHEKITDDKIEKALGEIMKMLSKNGIALGTICEVDDRELYRFITEELFQEKIDDISVPGMMTHFIYEEFYPNHPYDVEQAATGFVKLILPRQCDVDDWFFNEELKVSLSDDRDRSRIIQEIKDFVGAYSAFDIQTFEIKTLELSDDNQEATVIFKLAYLATIEGSLDEIRFDGQGSLTLSNVFERLGVPGWDVVAFNLPGLKK